MNILTIACITHIIFSCCVYLVWNATGDMIAADWLSYFPKLFVVLILMLVFAWLKTMTLNRFFERV